MTAPDNPTPKVIVDSMNHRDLPSQIADSAAGIGLVDDLRRASAVFIKPNLTYPRCKQGVTTRVEFVRDLVKVCTDVNPSAAVLIGEGEGGYNSFSMSDAMAAMGFNDLKTDFPRVEILNLSKIPSRSVDIEIPGGAYTIALPSVLLDGVDFSITCPVPKVHCMTRISLAYKNQWGCLPDVMRLKNHYVFEHIIAPICGALKFRYAFLDGKWGLDRTGPMAGVPVQLDWFAASNSLGAFDIVLSELMGFDWRTIRHIRRAHDKGLAPSRSQITVTGPLDALRYDFTLKRGFWSYPALTAFHSKFLTHLFYFSILSEPLHRAMYLFRRKPIDPA